MDRRAVLSRPAGTCWRSGLLAVSVLLLSACGGGGGDEPAPQSATTPAAPPATPLYDVQGAISVPSGMSVDGDVNNPSAPLTFNNLPANAQVMPNPVTIGGYANVAGAGAAGRSQTLGDVSDFFRINLLDGQAISLIVADAPAADLDLYLWNAAGTLILDASLGTGSTESLTIAGDGQYLVEVFAQAGASNYVLSVGQSQPLINSNGLRLSAAFVPGEIILLYANSPDSSAAAAPSSTPRRGFSGDPRRARLMRMAGRFGLSAGPRADAKGLPSAGRIDRRAALSDAVAQEKWDTLIAIKDLKKDSQVSDAEPNYLLATHAEPNDSFYGLQWHYPLIGLPAAWDNTTGDAAVTVAVIDSGILPGHPDMQNQLIPGFDFISQAGNAGDGDGIDPDPTDPGDGPGQGSSSFHGTHVAGTIAAQSNNGAGVAGTAWDINIMPLRVCGLDGCSLYDIMQAVRYAAGLPNDSGLLPAAPVDVINMSLGGPSFSSSADALYAQVRQQGIVLVASAGNEANSATNYPAGHTSVLSVSAVGIDRELASYSSFGPTVAVAAPGGDGGDLNGDGYPDYVLSTGGDDSGGGLQYAYTFLAGTSMASPHVAGVVALMKSANAALTPDMLDQMLADGDLTDDLGAAGRDDLYGYGLINAQKAVAAALDAAGTPPPENPELQVQPASLNFGSAMTALSFNAINVGGGNLTVTGVASSEAWLTVQMVSTDGDGLGGYLAVLDRSGLPEGSYSATLTFTSTVNTIEVPVVMQVSAVPIVPDLGYLYVLLIDADSGDVVRQFDSASTTGTYAFQLNDIPPGDYLIAAGTDADNDFVICDAGEACGRYLSMDQPITLTVDGDLAGTDFSAGFVVSITPQSLNSDPGSLYRRQ